MPVGQAHRRAFIAGLGSAAAWPMLARGQHDNIRKIGWLSPGSRASDATLGFLQAMRERGYIEGTNLIVEYRWASGHTERLPDLAADLVRRNVDLIITAGTPATIAAKQATRTIPIVFAVAGAPVEKGLVASLAKPGANVTGLALLTDELKPLEILKEAVPSISRVAFLYDPDTMPGVFGAGWLRRAKARAHGIKIELEPLILSDPDRSKAAIDSLPSRDTALLVGNSAVNALARRRICAMASERRMPTASTEHAFADAGCFITYGEDQIDMHRRAAEYAARILRGANPAELPVELPTRFKLVVNLQAAKALGLEVAPSLLARADEVIE